MITLSDQQVTECYTGVEKLLYSITHKAAFNHQRHFDDLIGKTHTSFMECVNSFDPTRNVKFSTFVAARAALDLQNVCMKDRKVRETEESYRNEYDDLSSHNTFLLDLRDEVGEDARYVLDLIFEDDSRFNNRIIYEGDDTSCQKALKNYLHYDGWGRKRIYAAFKEIQERLNT